MTNIIYASGLEFETINPSDVDDGIDYSDPVGNAVVPLIRVKGRENENLSANFKVKELMANDPDAHYSRISPELVEALQKIRTAIGKPIFVRNSGNLHGGYRHQKLNRRVGGAGESQHISGRAADFEMQGQADLSGKELAKIAIEQVGCGIGVGIGRIHLHLDVRGQRDTWGYPLDSRDAQVEAKDFVSNICGPI